MYNNSFWCDIQGSQVSDTAAISPQRVTAGAGKTLILALGTPLRGDDGAGSAVLQAVVESQALPDGVVSLFDASPGDLMSALLSGNYSKVIVLDAVQSDRKAGEWIRFSPAEANFIERDNAWENLHNMNLNEVMILGEILGITFPEIVIFGIQPSRVDWNKELSPEVKRAIPQVCKAVLDEIDKNLNKMSIRLN